MIPKSADCYKPWCGVGGKRCIDCVQDYMTHLSSEEIATGLQKIVDDFCEAHAAMTAFAGALEALDLSETDLALIAERVDLSRLDAIGEEPRRCRICGCTDSDCRQCIEKTGFPCHWAQEDLCSACVGEAARRSRQVRDGNF